MEIVFWAPICLVFYNLVAFPALVVATSYLFGRGVRRDASYTPTLTILVTAHNEERHIAAKIANTLAIDYPPENTQVLIALDGCTDGTQAIAESVPDARIRVVAYPRLGKTPTQNAASKEASGEIILYTDATTEHPPDVARKLVACCADPSVGCVTGSVVFASMSGATAQGLALRLGYEQFVRGRLGLLYSMLGATGAIYAMPKRFVEEVPGGLTHDFAAPVLALMHHKRTVYEPLARAFVARPLGDRDELRRRTRIAVQGLAGVLDLPGALDPVRHPRLTFVLVSMRLLKWLIPVFLVLAFVSNATLLALPFYRATFAVQLAFYGAAALGAVVSRSGKAPRILSVPLYFCLLNLAALRALWLYLRGERYVRWEATSR